jgi:hypothetical protein
LASLGTLAKLTEADELTRRIEALESKQRPRGAIGGDDGNAADAR